MILAVISYPYHYHITQLAIKHALANIDGITDVKIIWDDKTMPCTSSCIPFSEVCLIPTYVKGWYAQQVIKLNLHNVLKGDICIIDGDVILNQNFAVKDYFYAPKIGNKSKSFSKIKELLGIDQFNFINAPLMHVHTDWLHELHSYKTNINRTYFKFCMTDWTSNGEWPISEWDLLYNFLTYIKKLDRNILPFEFKFLDTSQFELSFNKNDNFILKGKDNFSVDFYQKHNISINETLWKQIYGALV